MDHPTNDPDPGSDTSFLRTNLGIVYLSAILAVPAYIASVIVGLNVVFTTAMMVLFFAVAVAVQRLRRRRNPTMAPSTWSGVSGTGILAALVVFVLIQAVPYGRSHTNGSIAGEPAWPDTETRALVVRACFDCHSNEVKYPWYSNIAPTSWLVAEHVSDGRSAVNFSTMASGGRGGGRVVRVLQEGSMPPAYFTRFGLHHQAKLTKAEIAKLIAGLNKMPEFQPRTRSARTPGA